MTSQPLDAALVHPHHPDYAAILAWPFPAEPFYVGQVLGVLRDDIPQRVLHGTCYIYLYRDKAGNAVGFGTFDLDRTYASFTGGLLHGYIPVLGVRPDQNGRGYGRQIVDHLVSEAVLFHRSPHPMSDLLFLDVYGTNAPAIGLYEKCGFQKLNPTNPIPDPQNGNEPYFVMARKLA